jgi:hypothetical protein
MFAFPAKSPGDVVNPMVFDFTQRVPPGAVLVGTPQVTAAPGSITIGAVQVLGARVLFQVAGGTSGVTYTLTVVAQDSAGNTWNRQATLPVAQQ